MNFSSMEYFTVLAQERNFTRAEERLHITQQSLSSYIAGMEKELGSQLAGDYSTLRVCPFVMGGIEDIDGRIGG